MAIEREPAPGPREERAREERIRSARRAASARPQKPATARGLERYPPVDQSDAVQCGHLGPAGDPAEGKP